MPTLYLIDADSSQACPAVIALMNETFIASHGSGDRLLLLGGGPLRRCAQAVGVTDAEHLAVSFGKVSRDLFALKRWLRNRRAFDRVHCGSIGALHAAARWMPGVPTLLTLAHSPPQAKLLHLHRLAQQSDLRVTTLTHALRDRLVAGGLSPKSIDVSPPTLRGGWIEHRRRDELRSKWGINGPRQQVVALISDHASLIDAIDGAMVAYLVGETLTDDRGAPAGLTLLVHPDQTHRLRAQDLLAEHVGRHRVVQEPGLTQPWKVLAGCDAALALGPDGGGVSLFWSHASGLPIIAPPNGPAKELAVGKGLVLLSHDNTHKDLAHELHQTLAKPAGPEPQRLALGEEPDPQPARMGT